MSHGGIPRLPKGAHLLAGHYDRQGRWYPDADFCIEPIFPRTRQDRARGGAKRRFYSRRYSEALWDADPDLWADVTGGAPDPATYGEDHYDVYAAEIARSMR